jgi:hypothetical protein
MNSTSVFYALDDMFQSFFVLYDKVGNLANYSFLILGFVGFFIWMRYQKRFNDKAANDPNQLK